MQRAEFSEAVKRLLAEYARDLPEPLAAGTASDERVGELVDCVDISGDGQAFSDYIAPVEARWSDFMGKPIFHAGEDSSFHLEVNCNWKLAIENYCESYHLP